MEDRTIRTSRKLMPIFLASLLAGVLVLSGINPLGSTASTATTTATVRFVTWNVGLDNPRDVGVEVLDFMRFADIMGTQELNTGPEQDNVNKRVTCATCVYASNWSTHVYAGSSPNKHLIIWNKSKYTLINTGVVDVSPTTTVNDSVGASIPVKFINWVKLQDKASGRQFYVLNTHLVNGVEKNGKPRTDVSPLRIANYNNHMDKLLALINTLKADNVPIVATGDYNANYRYDRTVKNSMFPYVRMGSVGVRSTFDILNLAGISSTTPSRLIDYVFVGARPDVIVKTQKHSSSTHGSDHYALYATVDMTAPLP